MHLVKLIIFLFLIFRISPLSAEELVNSSNNINFSVEVIPSSCTVEWPGTVDFGHIELSQLNRGVSKEFYLTLKIVIHLQLKSSLVAIVLITHLTL